MSLVPWSAGPGETYFTLLILYHTQHTQAHSFFPQLRTLAVSDLCPILAELPLLLCFPYGSEIEIWGKYSTVISSFRQCCINGMSFEVRENHVHILVATLPG